MLKNILNLEGALQLSKNEQKEINGGIRVGCQHLLSDGEGGEIIPNPSSCINPVYPVFRENYYGLYRHACCTS